MKLLKQFKTLLLDDFEESVYSYPDHAHTYYEMIYIHKGSGQHFLNNTVMNYEPEDLFLIGPGDHHYFEIHQRTHFTFIKFTDNYFQCKQHLAVDDEQLKRPAYFMQLKVLKENKLLLDVHQQKILKRTVQNIVEYDTSTDDITTSVIVYYQILSIIGLVKEALKKMQITLHDGQPDNKQLAGYIHEHIYNKSSLQINNVAAHFHIAANYFSTYFRRSFGISYTNYVALYRNELLEKRILAGRMTLKQIASEFDFTDESHLVKYFKKYKGISPTVYRQQASASIAQTK